MRNELFIVLSENQRQELHLKRLIESKDSPQMDGLKSFGGKLSLLKDRLRGQRTFDIVAQGGNVERKPGRIFTLAQ